MNWVSFAFTVSFVIAELIFINKFIATKNKTAKKSSIGSVLLVAVTYILSDYFGFVMPNTVFILIIVALFMDSFFGYYRRLYYKSKKYDRLQHAIGTFSYAIYFYFFLSNIFEYGGSKEFQALYILLLGVFWGTLGEIMEYVSDLKNEVKMQRGLRDTNVDLLSDVIGSLSAALISYFTFL